MAAPFPNPDPSAAPPRPAPPTPPNPHEPDQGGLLGNGLPSPDSDAAPESPPRERPRLQQPVRGRRLAPRADLPASPLTAEQRLLVLDAWRRSGLPAGDFAPLVGVSKHTLYAWKRKFETDTVVARSGDNAKTVGRPCYNREAVSGPCHNRESLNRAEYRMIRARCMKGDGQPGRRVRRRATAQN
jgi:hypothetical protein